MFEQPIELAEEARSLAQSQNVLKNTAKSHWLEGQALTGMKRFDEAIKHFEKAVSITDEIQHGSLRWKIRLSLAEVLRKTGQSADVAIQQARTLIDQTLQSPDFVPIPDGDFDGRLAVASERLEISGDRALAERLLELVEPDVV